MSTEMPLADLTFMISQIENRLQDLESEYKKTKIDLESRRSKLISDRSMCVSGIDFQRIRDAQQVIGIKGICFKKIDGEKTESPQRNKVVSDAINDIAIGGEKLRDVYFGVKNYSSFGDQREDHKYGMSPRHGSIVFAVELMVRNRELTAAEIEDSIYYLMNIEQVQDSIDQ